MYPGFEPIIGSGFDAIAAQRAGWAGFNAARANENIGRLAQSQQTANDWLRTVAMNAQAQENQNANWGIAQRNSDLNREYQWGRIAAYEQRNDARLKEEARRTEALQKIADDKLRMQENERHNRVVSAGQTHASNLLSLDQEVRRQQELLAQARVAIDFNTAEKNSANPNPENAKLITHFTKQLETAQKALQRAQDRRDRAVANAQVGGFMWDDANGTLTHGDTGKIWNLRTAPTQDLTQAPAMFAPAQEEATTTGTAAPEAPPTEGPTLSGLIAPPAPVTATAAPAAQAAPTRPRFRYNPATDTMEGG